MSNTDIDAVALALQLSGILVTDDYSMQNTAVARAAEYQYGPGIRVTLDNLLSNSISSISH